MAGLFKPGDPKEISSILGGGGGCAGVSVNEYSCGHGAQINLGDQLLFTGLL